MTREDQIVERLQRALDRGGNTHTVADVVEAARQGAAQIWEQGDGIVATELVRYPQRMALRYWLAAGRLDDLLDLAPRLEDWARGHGATRVEAVGRRGWTKYTGALGYQPAGVLFTKEI